MKRHIVPARGGRGVLVRPGRDGEAVQLGILSTRGNIMQAVDLDRGQLPALVAALESSQELADRDLLGVLGRRRREARRRYQEALARNPWLTGSPSVFPRERYPGREP